VIKIRQVGVSQKKLDCRAQLAHLRVCIGLPSVMVNIRIGVDS
jgi:hypothetical protein